MLSKTNIINSFTWIASLIHVLGAGGEAHGKGLFTMSQPAT